MNISRNRPYKIYFDKNLNEIMNQPYNYTYHAPINSPLDTEGLHVLNGRDGLEELLRQAHKDAAALQDAVLRLSGELRAAKIDGEIANRKIEVLTRLQAEVVALRGDGIGTVSEHERTDQPMGATARPTAGGTRGAGRRARILWVGVALLVLASVALVVLQKTNGPLVHDIMDRAKTSFQGAVDKP